jgi:hypothetical protein
MYCCSFIKKIIVQYAAKLAIFSKTAKIFASLRCAAMVQIASLSSLRSLCALCGENFSPQRAQRGIFFNYELIFKGTSNN